MLFLCYHSLAIRAGVLGRFDISLGTPGLTSHMHHHEKHIKRKFIDLDTVKRQISEIQTIWLTFFDEKNKKAYQRITPESLSMFRWFGFVDNDALCCQD